MTRLGAISAIAREMIALLYSMRTLLSNAGSMLGTVALTNALGFPYWWIAARTFPAEAVGFAAATISAMTILGTCGMLGMGTFLTGEFARQARERGPLITTALASALCAGLVLGLVFAVVMPGPLGLHALEGRVGPVMLFATGVGLTSMTAVVDQALIGLLRGRLQLRRNAIFAATKLAALAAVGVASLTQSGLAIYATWVVGLAISIGWLVVVAGRQGTRLHRCPPRWRLLWSWRRHALDHHLLNLALLAPVRTLPLVTAAVVSVTASAYYYTASLITGFLAYGAIALSFALYAVGVHDLENLGRTLRFSLRLAFGIILLANLILFVGADPILRVFGPQYAAHAAWALRIMGVETLFAVIRDHYIAIARIRGTLRRAAAVAGVGAMLELAFGALGGAIHGISGVALGATIATGFEVIVMCPTLVRELSADPPHPPTNGRPDFALPEVSP